MQVALFTYQYVLRVFVVFTNLKYKNVWFVVSPKAKKRGGAKKPHRRRGKKEIVGVSAILRITESQKVPPIKIPH